MLLKYSTLKHKLAASNGLRAAGVARQRGVLVRRMSAHSTVSSQQGGCAISECKAVTIQWRCATVQIRVDDAPKCVVWWIPQLRH